MNLGSRVVESFNLIAMLMTKEEEEKSELSGQRSLEGMNFAIAELTTRKETWATDL